MVLGLDFGTQAIRPAWCKGLARPSMRLISKPFRTADLLATIDEMLGQP